MLHTLLPWAKNEESRWGITSAGFFIINWMHEYVQQIRHQCVLLGGRFKAKDEKKVHLGRWLVQDMYTTYLFSTQMRKARLP